MAALHVSRRQALKTAAATFGAAALPRWFLEELAAHAGSPPPVSANDRPGVALVGCGGRGMGIGREAAKFGRIVAVCDVDAARAGKAAAQLDAASYADFRKAVERDDVDVVVNGTPDHWHTLINVHALQSGKDVYSEKPLTRTIDEGRRLVEVARRTGRILQTGSQQRSDAKFRLACELVRNGRLGRLTQITTILPAGLHGGPFATSPVPQQLDWDFWLGPAPKVDYVHERCHKTFRYWYDYSGGTMTDWGAHHNDIAQWANGTERSGPVSVEGRPLVEPVPGGYDAASQYRVDYEYAGGVKLRCQSTTANRFDGSVQGRPGSGDLLHGVRFEGTDGWIFVTRGRIEASVPELLSDPLPSDAERLYVSTDHMGNFFDCVRTRKPPICDVEIGHRSVSVCHLGVIALRLGRKLEWDPAKEEFLGDAEANAMRAAELRAPWDEFAGAGA
jgi:predicted dehydrogenase